MRSQIVAFVVTAAIAFGGSAGALAQDATPEMEGESLFADLGLPELTITATAEGLSVDQPEIPAGRYLVTLDNQSGTPEIATGFVRLDEGEVIEDLAYADEIAAGTPALSEDQEPPVETYVFLFDNYITGGPNGASPQVVVDLPAGDYGVWTDDPFAEIAATPLSVTGDPATPVTGPEPQAVATIVEEGEGGQTFTFAVEGQLKSGRQIVKILNASDQPHFIEVLQYPEPITKDQLMATFMFDPTSGGTPSPDMLDFNQVQFAGYAAVQSTGTTQWITMDLSAGQAILLCFIPDPQAGGVPHAFEGMIELVDVA